MRYAVEGFGAVGQELEDGTVLDLLRPDELDQIPNGTKLFDVLGVPAIKGTDRIDPDTRFGYLAYGRIARSPPMSDQTAPQIEQPLTPEEIFMRGWGMGYAAVAIRADDIEIERRGDWDYFKRSNALASRPSVCEWRSIESAPKDTYVLVSGAGWKKPTIGKLVDTWWYDEALEPFYGDEAPEVWMPLPDPPVSTTPLQAQEKKD